MNYTHSPKVSRILALGGDMKTSDIQYLIKREVDHDVIRDALGMSPEDFQLLLIELNGNTKSGNRGKEPTIKMKGVEYISLCAKHLKDAEIAKVKGVSIELLRKWKTRNKVEISLVLRRANLNQLLYLSKHTSLRNLALEEFRRRENDIESNKIV